MALRIDQTGLSAGEAGYARKDGLSTGALVTLTDTAEGGTTLFEILWVSVDDTSAVSTLAPSDTDTHVWTFTPTAGVTGPIRIRLTHTDGGIVTTEIRIFGIPETNGFVTPAPGERADPNATLVNVTDPDVIARCERNWKTDHFPQGNPFGWGIELIDWIKSLASSGGGLS